MIEWFEDLSLGMRFKSETVQISEQEIKQFAARFDPQPFHLDDEAAQRTIFKGLAASGWHTAALVAGGDEFLAATEASRLPWDDPDPLRSAMERLVLHHPPAVDEESTTSCAIHHAFKVWVDQMADQYNDGYKWAHPHPDRTMPSPLILPLEFGTQ